MSSTDGPGNRQTANTGEHVRERVREHDANSEHAANTQGEQVREQVREHWYTVKDAAARLGVGERAVQRRADRGTLRSKQDGNRLLVCIDGVPALPEPSGEQTADAELPNEHVREHSEHTSGHVREHTNTPQAPNEHPGERVREHGEHPNEQAANSERAAYLAHLHSENAFLRAELTAQREQHAIAQSEMRRLMLADRAEIAQLRQQLAIEAAPVVADGDAPTSVQTEAEHRASDTAALTPNTQYPTAQDVPEVGPADGAQATGQGGKLDADGEGGRQPEPRRRWWEWWK